VSGQGEIVGVPRSHQLMPLFRLCGGRISGQDLNSFEEVIIPCRQFSFLIFSWAFIHRGRQWLDVSFHGRKNQVNWRKFSASNSALSREFYGHNETFPEKMVTDGSEPVSTGRDGRGFFKTVRPLIYRGDPMSRWPG